MLKKDMKLCSCILMMLIFLQAYEKPTDAFIIRLITETLQNNVAGEPITHERTEWDFDPEAAKKARAIFYETHGYRASKFIERLGVGRDGHEEERRQEQQLRDLGRINGEHNIIYPAPN